MQWTFIFRISERQTKSSGDVFYTKTMCLVQIFSVFIQAIQHKNITIYMINQNKEQPVYREIDFFLQLIIALCCDHCFLIKRDRKITIVACKF